MNQKFPLLLITAGTLFVAALVVALQAGRSARETADALDAIVRERTRLDAAVRAAEARGAAAEKPQTVAQSSLDRVHATEPVAPVAPSRPPPAPKAVNPRELLAKDPMLQALSLAANRARLAQEYGSFFATQQLTSAQIEQFTANLMKGQEQLVDLMAAAQAQGADSREAVATLQKRVHDEVTAAQTALLGAEGFQRMKDHERSAQPRLAIEGLIGSATLEGIPLTATQATQLTAALAGASSRFAAGGRAELATVDWDAADARARQILTPAQFALFISSAPVASGASRWNHQLDAAISRAKQIDAASAPPPKPPGS